MGMYHPCWGSDFVDADADVDYEVWQASEREVPCQPELALRKTMIRDFRKGMIR
jgi:SHS2 domain-containing protein